MINKNRLSLSLSKEVADYLRETAKTTSLKISTIVENIILKVIKDGPLE